MARPSVCNPLSYVIDRQIDDRTNHCKRLVNARLETSENLFRKDLTAHYGCINAIEFSAQGDLLVSGGDDRRVLLWKVEQAIQNSTSKPVVMKAHHGSNIFCLGYDSNKTKIFSGGNDEQVIVHDLQTGDVLNFFLHEKPVYGLSIHPHNDNVFASACDDGRVLMYDIRGVSAIETLAQYKAAFHSVMFNPVEPRMLATANAKEGVSMWDVRKPLEPVLRYGTESPVQSCMNARFNAAGNKLLALRRRLPPVLYAVDSPVYLCQFDHPGYYNSCTMKSCCFAGENDQYVLSGSDDFHLYMWKIPSESIKWVGTAHMVLRGHRSIVNQVRYNPASCILASSGVEKIVKIWSPFTLGSNSFGGLKRDSGRQERQRRIFTHDEYLGLVIRSGQLMTHDYSQQSTKEDPRMMAFFDSLVQREIEGWSSEDMPTAPQTPSDSENNATTGRTYSATDSDDSTASDRQLMLCLLGSARSRGSSGAGVAPERSLESPNRITRLIANRREKLMRLAALDCGAPLNTSNNTAPEPSASCSASEGDNAQLKSKSNSHSKLRGVKRKHGRVSGRRSRARKKCMIFYTDDSDSEAQPVDTTQPSTSSGVVSRRSRYVTTTLENESWRSSYSSTSSDSSSEDNDDDSSGKRKDSHTDSDASTSAHKRKHRKCKNNSKRDNVKSKNKRQRVDEESEDEKTERKEYTNGTTRLQNDDSSTPVKKTCKVPSTPDSGITSGVSTVEKNAGQSSQKTRNEAESSDHEQKLRNLECFRKKVNVARRLVRKRSQPQTVSTTTDSSD